MLKTTLFVMSALLSMPNLAIQSALAQMPSLNDGIMCTAKGKTAQGARIYAYTSVIDDASLKNKQPVSVTIVQPVSDLVAGEVVVIDKQRQTVLIDDFAAETSPEMQPVGLATTLYQGRNTFSGKTKAGTPISFTLDNNYRVFQIKHGNETYTGVCH